MFGQDYSQITFYIISNDMMYFFAFHGNIIIASNF
jgi:hypothetical protein